jgi:hypothetical protein
MTAEIDVAVQRGIPPVIFVLGSKDQHFGTRRFRFVAAGLAAFIGLALVLAVTLNVRISPIASLSDMLCCDGCCRMPLLQPKVAISEPTRATILHLSGSTEIDYTDNGHRVPLHMESALNELDHIERHVKLGLPKYLQESAAQREADLVDHKFARDLEGTDDHAHGSRSSASNDHASESKGPADATTRLGAKPTVTQAVAEASRMERQFQKKEKAEASKMERHLREKDEEEKGRILVPSSRELSRAAHDAEKEASHFGALGKKCVPLNSLPYPPELIPPT